MRLILIFQLFVALALPGALTAADAKAINTVCPVTGKAVDAAVPAVIITVGKGERAQKVVIGVADAAAAEKVKADPEAYVAAAKANRRADR